MSEVVCPICGEDMWDNRGKKSSGEFSQKSPDFKCKDKTCKGVIWPPKDPRKKEFKTKKEPIGAIVAKENESFIGQLSIINTKLNTIIAKLDELNPGTEQKINDELDGADFNEQ